jgi:hydrogenase expression/formation protein HypE
VEPLLVLGPGLRFLRDPTRGGVAATLNEIASLSGRGVLIEESAVPLDRSVVAAAEMLGIDPLQAANEGKIVAVVEKGLGEKVLELWKDVTHARGASIIGEIISEHPHKVIMKTRIGGTRVLAEPSGELLPRIC